MKFAAPVSSNLATARTTSTASPARRMGAVVVALLLAVAGCGKKALETGQVEGVVRVNGQPHKGLMVRFMPDLAKNGVNLSVNSTGISDAQGKYTLKHVYDDKAGEGAPVGWHRVVIEDMSHGPTPQGQAPPPPLFPATYNSPVTTPLSVEVKAGTQTIDLDVK